MENNEIIIFLEEMKDRIKNSKLQVSIFKNYCDFVQILYIKKYSINYLYYVYLLDSANVFEPKNQTEYLIYQYYKGNIKALIYKLENEKSK